MVFFTTIGGIINMYRGKISTSQLHYGVAGLLTKNSEDAEKLGKYFEKKYGDIGGGMTSSLRTANGQPIIQRSILQATGKDGKMNIGDAEIKKEKRKMLNNFVKNFELTKENIEGAFARAEEIINDQNTDRQLKAAQQKLANELRPRIEARKEEFYRLKTSVEPDIGPEALKTAYDQLALGAVGAQQKIDEQAQAQATKQAAFAAQAATQIRDVNNEIQRAQAALNTAQTQVRTEQTNLNRATAQVQADKATLDTAQADVVNAGTTVTQQQQAALTAAQAAFTAAQTAERQAKTAVTNAEAVEKVANNRLLANQKLLATLS